MPRHIKELELFHQGSIPLNKGSIISLLTIHSPGGHSLSDHSDQVFTPKQLNPLVDIPIRIVERFFS